MLHLEVQELDTKKEKLVVCKLTIESHRRLRKWAYMSGSTSIGQHVRKLIEADLDANANKIDGLDRFLAQAPGVAGKVQRQIISGNGPDIQDILG